MATRVTGTAAVQPVLELREIVVQFGATTALAGASLVVRPNTVHALLGENGAGKTTLMRVAFGMLAPRSGVVNAFGTTRVMRSPADALRSGIGMVSQHFALVDAMTVAENVTLGGSGLFDPAGALRRVDAVARASGLAIDPHARVGSLSVSARQRVEILKALARDVRLLILDEPTAVLPPSEAQELLRWIRGFATDGRSAILITHKLRDALAVANDVTVLRAGRTVLASSAGSVSGDDLAKAMLGAPVETSRTHGPRAPGPVVVAARALSVCDARGAIRVRDATLEIRAGEVLAIAAIEGSGQDALMRVLAGRADPLSGTIERPPAIGFIPEDRHRDALVLDMHLADNVALRGAGTRRGWLRTRALEDRTAHLLRLHDVRAPGPRTPARALSGGNQQKLVLARELDPLPHLVVAENPWRGLDVRASAAVTQKLKDAADAGAAVVVTSSDIDDLVGVADRVLVLHAGTLTAASVDPAAIGRAMVGA